MDMHAGIASVWILAGSRRGDNNQMLALAEALGLPFEIKTVAYNRLHHLPLLRRGLLHVERRARASIKPPWPNLVIGVGPNSAPVSRYIRRRSGGRARLVQIGDPRSPVRDLDLLIVTPQFIQPEAANILALPFPMGDPARSVTVTSDEDKWLSALPRPRRLIAVGGWTRKWKLDDKALGEAIQLLQTRSAGDGGSIIAVTSPRTPLHTRRLLERRLTGANEAVVEDFPRFAALLAGSDEIYVTADSVSMLSEAILTGKPVGMIKIARTMKGRLSHVAHRLGLPLRADLAKFWAFLSANNLVGTVDSPVASDVNDSVLTAAAAVRSILDRVPAGTR
jgi:mitochondrial fission protein ELM1